MKLLKPMTSGIMVHKLFLLPQDSFTQKIQLLAKSQSFRFVNHDFRTTLENSWQLLNYI